MRNQFKKDLNAKELIKTLKENSQMFSVKEPDAHFESRMLAGLRASAEWKANEIREREKRSMGTFFDIISKKVASLLTPANYPALGVGFAAVLVAVLVGTQGFENVRQSVFSNSKETVSKVASLAKQGTLMHPEMAAILKKGGEKTLRLWVLLNGDMGETTGAGELTVAERSPAQITEEEQKRILSELEKKWASAL